MESWWFFVILIVLYMADAIRTAARRASQAQARQKARGADPAGEPAGRRPVQPPWDDLPRPGELPGLEEVRGGSQQRETSAGRTPQPPRPVVEGGREAGNLREAAEARRVRGDTALEPVAAEIGSGEIGADAPAASSPYAPRSSALPGTAFSGIVRPDPQTASVGIQWQIVLGAPRSREPWRPSGRS